MKIKNVKELPFYEVEVEVTNSTEEVKVTINVIQIGYQNFSPMDEGDYMVMQQFGYEKFNTMLQEYVDSLH